MSMSLPNTTQYCPYSELGEQPNIIVDGKAQRSTVLTLSHWPWNTTPSSLLRDTSTDIVFAYLDSPEHHQNVPLVSNSHFDEDGLLSMYVLVSPEHALKHRELMIGASRAGDFSVGSSSDAVKLSFILAAYADPDLTPLPKEIFGGSDAQQVAGLYTHMLDVLPELLEDIPGKQEYWQEEWDHLQESETAIERGDVVIDEVPDLELAIVHIPEDMPARTVRRYLSRWQRSAHPIAVHNATQCSRLVWAKGDSVEFQYRYESWIQLASRRPARRIDLSGLADQFNVIETAGGSWIFEGVNEVAPRLRLEGSCRSSIRLADFLARLSDWLRTQPIAWDPYKRID